MFFFAKRGLNLWEGKGIKVLKVFKVVKVVKDLKDPKKQKASCTCLLPHNLPLLPPTTKPTKNPSRRSLRQDGI